ncbi:MAG: CobW family GTP-binding protein, partial [Hyphomicrobiaceae bacterium]
MKEPRLPVTIITGFLGSGKTTILNHLLRDPGLQDTAVIVNEFGEIGLDHLLVESASDQMVLMDNGCLCCSVRGDLVDTLSDLLRRVEDGRVPSFRRVIIETTGLADPAPIAQTLVSDEDTATHFYLKGIVATVDGINGVETL